MKIHSFFWHSVEPDSINPAYRYANPTASIFREQIRFILNNYTPISIYDFMEIITSGNHSLSYSKPPVLLGFDDGFKNVIAQALPILNEFKIPALFFVIGEILKNTDFIPWYIETEHQVRRTTENTVMYCKKVFKLSLMKDRLFLRTIFKRRFKECKDEDARQELLTELSSLLRVNRPIKACDLDDDLRFVNKDDLSNLDSTSLLTVASHAMTHRLLASLGFDEQTYELEQSNLLLNKYCKSYYPVIAYPAGSFNRDTISIAKHIYKFGFAVLLGSSYNNSYAYRRSTVSGDNIKELKYVLGPLRLNLILPLKLILHKLGLRRID